MNLDAVAEELYGLPVEEFTRARDARVAQARDSGDRQLAAEIRKLRRPTASAWLVNLLVRERGAQLDELLRLGTTLREAQASLAGDELRRLSTQRRQVVTALGHEARRLAYDLGHPVSETVERELEGTLEAALADPQAADAVRSGRLTAALRYSGMGELDAAGAVSAIPPPAAGRVKRGDGAPGQEAAGQDAARRELARQEAAQRELEATEQAVREAEEAALEARRAADDRERAVRQALARRDELASQVRELERQLERLQEEQAATARDIRETQRARDAADRTARAAERRLAQARAKLEALRG